MSAAHPDGARDEFMWSWAKTRAFGRSLYVARSALVLCLVACAWPVMQENFGLRPTPPALSVIMWLPVIFVLAETAATRFPFVRWIALIPVAIALIYYVPQLPLLPPWDVVGEYALGGAILGGVLGVWAYYEADKRFTKLLAEGAAIPAARPVPSFSDLKPRLLFLLLIVAAFGPVLILGLLK